MQELPMADFQERLLSLLSELEISGEVLASQGPRVPGPQCRLDGETFRMLAESFPLSKYSLGVMVGFAQVKNFLRPADLRRASQEVRLIRRTKGRHSVQVPMYQSELEELSRIAHQAELSMSAVLEATTYLFVRAEGSIPQVPL